MSGVEAMYQEIILDHYREKHHAGLREPYDVAVSHVNPSCGDELDLRLTRDGDTIVDVSYTGVGCSISQASTSIMTDLVIGGTAEQALRLYDGFVAMLESQGNIELDEVVYGDAIAFNGVAQFPARVKCALLGWSALKDAIVRTEAGKEADGD